MEVGTIAGILIAVYTFLYFTDKYLKNVNSVRYAKFLQKFPVQIDFMSVKTSTTVFNRALSRLAVKFEKFFGNWYSVGTVVTLTSLVPAVLLLGSTAVSSILNLSKGVREDAVLQPVLPGVNLPKSEWLFYFTTIFICTVIHEIGHAIAAVGVQVPLLGLGAILFLVLPAAFVELPTNSVVALSPWKQMKIYCAGVWHNVVLSAAALVILMILPYLVIPIFQTGAGVYLYSFNDYSTVGSHDFQVGDVLTAVADCPVTSKERWKSCLTDFLRESQPGFCLEKTFLPPASNSELCCPETEAYNSHLCFHLPSETQDYCVKARDAYRKSNGLCRGQGDCASQHQVCVVPTFGNESNVKLIPIERQGADAVLYVGQATELYASLEVSGYLPRTSLISPAVLHFLEKLLSYIISFSAGLAVLNVVPCVAMDGQHILRALCDSIPARYISSSTKERVLTVTIIMGTSLIVVNVIVGLYLLFT